MVGLACMLPFVLCAVFAFGSTNAYWVTVFATLIPSFGAGFVLYGFMDRMMDYLWGPAPDVAQLSLKEQSEMKVYILKV